MDLGIAEDLVVGLYVLQINGVTTGDEVRSVNVLLEVIAGAPKTRTKELRGAAFYEGGSAVFTNAGRAKLGAMVADVSKGATNVRVNVVGVSVSQDSPRANLEVARERAQGIVDELQASGVKGAYTVSVSMTFEIRDSTKSPGTPQVTGAVTALEQPAESSSGKPLTTVTITYDAPAP